MTQMNKTNQEDEAFLKALSPVVNLLIDENFANSKEKIAEQIAPTIGPAIKEQIKSQKDDIIDALYPIMGNMITRYVSKLFSEMINTINLQIQNGLSFAALSRKVRAKIKGVSETELLLEESASSNIRAAFLIHKETGIVLAQAQNKSNPINESEMLASMMTAIRSFVNDWIEQNDEHSELGEIEYGGSKIILEASGHSYLAVIVDGFSLTKTDVKIRELLGSIVLEHADKIKSFNGDLTEFTQTNIEEKLTTLLLNEDNQAEEKKKLHPVIFLIPIIIVALLSWRYYYVYMDDKISTQVNKLLYQTQELTTYRLNADVTDEVVTLSGEVPYEYHKRLALKTTNKVTGIKRILNNIIVIPTLTDPMQISSNISYLITGLNSNSGVNLTYDFDFDTLIVKGTTWDTKRKLNALEQIKKIPNIKHIKEEITIIAPSIKQVLYFENALTKITPLNEIKLIETIMILKQLDTELSITVTAYSDMRGNPKRSQQLIATRATNVTQFLKNQGKILQDIKTYTLDIAPQGVDYIKNPDLARCVIISYEQKEQ